MKSTFFLPIFLLFFVQCQQPTKPVISPKLEPLTVHQILKTKRDSIKKLRISSEEINELTQLIDWGTTQLGQSDSAIAQLHIALGYAYFKDFQYPIAIKNYEKANEIWQKTDAQRYQPVINDNYLNIASLRDEMGDYHLAINDYEQALHYFIAENDQALVAETYQLMGVAALHARDSAKITFLETGLAIISAQNKPDLDLKAALWQNLGKAETDFRHNYFKSLALFNAAYAHYQTLSDSANRAETAIEMAKTNLLKTDYPMAKKWANDALELRKALGSRKIIECYDVLGNIAQAQGQPDSALFFYQNALKTLDFSFKNDDVLINPNISAKDVNQKIAFINVLSHKIGPLSILHQKTKNRRYLTAAFETYQRADALIQALRRDMRDDAAKYFWNETALPLYKKGIDMAYQLYELDQNPTYKLAILQCSERTKAPVLREGIADNAAKSFAGVPAYERQQERALRTRIAILEQRLNNLDKDPSVTTLLSQTRRQLYAFQDSLKTKYPTYARYLESISKDNPLSINDLKSIQKQLSDSTLLLEYAFGNQDIYTIALSNTDFKIFKKPLTPDFHAQIDRFINAVSDVEALKTDFNAAGKAYSETSFDLYQRLLEAPLVHFNAKNSIKRIHCVLEGKLHLLPFKALTDRKIEGFKGDYPQHFLVQKFAFSSLFSIQMLTQKDPSVSPLDTATFKLACFGLDFKDAALWRQKDAKSPIRKKNDVLTYAEPEIKGIASAFNGRFYFNQEATKPVFIADAPQYDFLHITTHGYPEGLVFQKKTATDSLNEVSIGDIYGLSLHTKFTFLSACETGKGTITEAEGVMSLGRAFTSAGSQSVSMTLWSIPDGATAEIAQRFYTNCHQGMPKDVAEQQAEKDYLNHPSSDAQLHPNNWAALTIIGDMSPIAVEKKGVKAWFWGFFIGLLILVLLILFSRNFFKT